MILFRSNKKTLPILSVGFFVSNKFFYFFSLVFKVASTISATILERLSAFIPFFLASNCFSININQDSSDNSTVIFRPMLFSV